MKTEKLPHRLRESSFRRYEQAIHSIVESWPSVVILDPGPLSNETYSARLRDAIQSLLQYNWPTSIDVHKLRKLRHEIVVSNRDGTIVAGPRHNARPPLQPVVQSAQTLSLTNPTSSSIEEVCRALSERRSAPVNLKGNVLPTLQRMEKLYDISFVEEPDGSFTVF